MIARRKLSAHSSLIPPRMFPMQYWLGYILWQWGFSTLYVTQHASSMAVVAWVWSLKGPSVDNTQNRTESYNGRLRTGKSLRLNRGVRKGRVTERENRSCWIVCTIMFSHMWGVTEICILQLLTASQHEQGGSSNYTERQEIRIFKW